MEYYLQMNGYYIKVNGGADLYMRGVYKNRYYILLIPIYKIRWNFILIAVYIYT